MIGFGHVNLIVFEDGKGKLKTARLDMKNDFKREFFIFSIFISPRINLERNTGKGFLQQITSPLPSQEALH